MNNSNDQNRVGKNSEIKAKTDVSFFPLFPPPRMRKMKIMKIFGAGPSIKIHNFNVQPWAPL